MAEVRVDVDVVVVGAGLAGLVTARDLVAAGRSVLVLEALDRVGGRTANAQISGVDVDLGAAFVGPTQDRVLALAAELGCVTAPTWDTGRNLIHWRGRVRAYSGTIPKIGVLELADLARVRWLFSDLVPTVPLGRPWLAPRAAALDAQTLGSWLTSVRALPSTHELMAVVARVTWGCEPGELSLLHALHYVHGCGGLDRMLDTADGAQQDHFPHGTQQLSVRLAERLGDRVVLDAPVTAISWSDDGACVATAEREVGCSRVVVAVPPLLRQTITFDPLLPGSARALSQRWPQGVLTKAYASYATPFWRDAGLSGQALLDTGPVMITFDTTTDAAGPGVMLGFVGGRDALAFRALPVLERRLRVLSSFASLFGPAALDAESYVEQHWADEPYSGGGPTAAVPPGAWTTWGPHLRAPVGPVHWAGTETADEWSGFMDGAVRSGERAAQEVLLAAGGGR